jgi:hypothetical protein
LLYIIKSVTLAAPLQTAFYIDFKPAAAVIAPASQAVSDTASL